MRPLFQDRRLFVRVAWGSGYRMAPGHEACSSAGEHQCQLRMKRLRAALSHITPTLLRLGVRRRETHIPIAPRATY